MKFFQNFVPKVQYLTIKFMHLTKNTLKTIYELKICAELTKSFLKEFIA